MTAAAGEGRFVFGGSPGRAFAIRAFRAPGDEAWSYPIPAVGGDSASMVARGGRLYAALYRAGATGGRVVALDAATGHAIWEVPLQGLGPLHHSKYATRLRLAFVDPWLVVFGDESAGRYVEVVDPDDGHRVAHRIEQRG